MEEMINNVNTTKERGQLSKKEFFKRITIDPVDNSATLPVHQQSLCPQPEPILLPTSESISPSSRPSVSTPSETTLQKPILKYTGPIKKQKVITFDKLVQKKNKLSIIEDEGNLSLQYWLIMIKKE